MKFQSTLPARGATLLRAVDRKTYDNFNPRSPHGERLWRIRLACRSRRISIHAPRTGSDVKEEALCSNLRNFNPRSPHGERRQVSKP